MEIPSRIHHIAAALIDSAAVTPSAIQGAMSAAYADGYLAGVEAALKAIEATHEQPSWAYGGDAPTFGDGVGCATAAVRELLREAADHG